MSRSTQFHPLLFNPTTGEPYLRLPNPFGNIIITPPRMNDVPYIVENWNDPQVYRTLGGQLPFPYLECHAVDWLRKLKKQAEAVSRDLEYFAQEHPHSPPMTVDRCPVRILREVLEDGTELFLGDLGVERCDFPDHGDAFERARLVKLNKQREIGDEDIVWCIGDYIRSSHHGRGIMTVAMRTIIHDWMIPRMNTRLIRAEVFKGNIASVRVFEKNGFVLEETVDFEKVTTGGVKQTGMHILWWRYEQR